MSSDRRGARRDGTIGEIEAFTRAIAENPGDAWAYYSRGIALRLKGRPEEAAEDFRKALALDPGHISAIYHLGAALRTLGRLDEALAAYDRALSLDAALPWAAYNRGLILSRQGRYAAAIEDFTQDSGAGPELRHPCGTESELRLGLL